MVKLVGKTSSSSSNSLSQNKEQLKTEEVCSKCKNTFSIDEIETYYGKPYCDPCLTEKKRRKKAKKKEKAKKKAKTHASTSLEGHNTDPSLEFKREVPKPQPLPPLPQVKRDFLSWLKTLDINEYSDYRSALNRIHKYNRPAIVKQTVELFWEFMLKENVLR